MRGNICLKNLTLHVETIKNTSTLTNWDPEDYQKLFELYGTDNPVALDDYAPIILRVVALLKAEATIMINLLKNRPYTEHLMSLTTDGAPDLTD